MILAIVGMTGSGKSEVAQHLATLGYPAIRFGQVVIDEIARRGLELNPQNEKVVREGLRAQEGMDVCAKRCLPAIEEATQRSPLVIIDGLYSWSEYKTLRAGLGEKLILLLVFTSRELRYDRLNKRPVRPFTFAQAEDRDISEIEKVEKGGPIAFADHALLNDGTKAELCAAVDRFLARWQISSPTGQRQY